MLIPPKLFIIEVYGLKHIFEKEPIYLIFRESDGIILSYNYDLQGASSRLKFFDLDPPSPDSFCILG